MAILTRETNGTGVTNNGAPLTNAELDNNFIEIVADVADKVEVSGAIVFAAKAGEALTKGDVVYVSGVSGNEPVVSKADADDASKMPAFGLAEADASLNAAVNVVTFGTLYDLDTSGFTAGDTVYVSTTAGGLTATKPAGEASLIQNIGKVIRPHASAGSIKVGGAGRSNDTPNLNNGNVFIGNASNQVETRALVEADISDLQTYLTAESDTLDSVTGRGATTTNNIQVGNATVTGNLTVQGATTTLNTATLDVEDKNITINYSTGDSSGSADGAGITIQDAVNSTTDATILWDATGDKFEFSHAVDVAGNITLTGTVDGRDIATDGTKLDGIEASADVTDATNVAAAGAVMDGDFTSNGFMRRTGAGTYTVDTSTYLTSVSVDGLSDATITSVADNEVLAYDSTSSEWINQTAAEANLATSTQGTLADSALQPADLSVTTNAAGTAALTYTSGTGVFSYTPPDLSSYLTSYTETDTLDSVTGRGATTANAVTVGNLTSTGIDDNATSTAITVDSSQNVGIGVTDPDAKLEIFLADNDTSTYFHGGGFRGLKINDETITNNGDHTKFNKSTSTGTYSFYNSSGELVRIASNGDLHADGDVIAYSATISDQRLKDDVETIETALDKVGNLRGVTYTWNAGSRAGQRDYGVIAQEVEQVIPEIVREKEMALIDGETYKTVDYEKLTAVLIEAVKELKAEVDALKAAQ